MYLRRFSSLLVLNTTKRSRDGIKRKLYRPYDFSPHVCRRTEAERVFLTVYQALSCGPKSMYLRRFLSLLVLNTTKRSRDGIKRKLYRPYDFSPHVCRLTEAERVFLTAYQALSCGPKSMHLRRFSSLLVLNTTERSRDGIKRKLYRPYDFSPHVRRLTEAEKVFLTVSQTLSCGPKSMYLRRFSSLLVLNTTKRSRDGIKRKLYRPYDFSPHVCRLTEAERVLLTAYQALSCGPKSMHHRRFSSLLVLNTTKRSRDGIKRKLYRPYDFSPHVCRLTEAERVLLTAYQALSCGPKSMHHRRFSSLLVLNTTKRSRDGIKRKLYRPYDFSPHVRRLTEAERVLLTAYQALSCGPKSMHHRRFSSLLVLNTTKRSRDGIKRKLYRPYDFSPHVCRLTEAERVFLTVYQALSCGPKSMYLRRFSSLLVLNTTERSRDGIKRKLYRPYDFSPHVCRLTEAERVFLTVYQALSCGPKSMYLRRFSSLLVLNTTERSRDGIKRKLYRPYDFSPHVCRLTEAERVFLTVYQALSCGPKSMYLRRFSSLLVLNTTERSRDGTKRKLYRQYDFSPHVCRLTEAEKVFLTVSQALSCGPKSMYLRRFSSLLVLNTTKRSRDGIKRKLYRPYDFSPHVCRLTEAERVFLTVYQALSCGPKSMYLRRFSSLLVLNTTERSRDGIKRKLYRPYDFSPHVCRLTEAERVFLTVYQALSCGPKSMYLRRFSSLLVLNTTERSRDGIKRKLYRPYDFSPHVCRRTEDERVLLTAYQALSCGPKSMYLRRFSSLLVLNTTERSRDGIKRKLYRPYDFSPHVCRLTEAERVFLTVYQALSCGPKSMYLRRFSSLLVLNTTERSRDGIKRKLYRPYDFSPHVCRRTEDERVLLTAYQALSCGPKSMYLRRFSSLLVLNTTKRSRDGIKRKLYRPYDFSPHVCRLTEAERVFLTVYQALSCGPKSMYLRRFSSLLVLNTTERSRDGIKRKLYRPYDFSPHVCRLTEAERVFLTVYQALSCGPKSMYLRRFSSLLVLNTTERSRDGIKRKLYRPYDFSPHVCRRTEDERVLLTAYQALSCGPKSMYLRRFSSLLVLNTTKRSRDGIKRKLYRPYDFSPHVCRLTEAERVFLTVYQALSCGPKSMYLRRFLSLLVLNTTERSRDGIKRKLYRQYDFSPHVCRLTEAERVFLTVSQALSCGPKSMYLRRFSSLLVLNTTERSRDGIKRKLYRPYDFSPHVRRLTEAEKVFLTVSQTLSCGPKSMYLRRFSSLLVLNTTERSRDGIKRKLYRPYDFSPHVRRLTEAERVLLTAYQALSCGPKSMHHRRFSSLLVLNTTKRSRDGIKRKLYRPYDFSPHVCRLTEAERVFLTVYQALSCGPKSMYLRRFLSLLVLNTTKRSRDGIKRKLYRPYDFSPHVCRLTEAERVFLTVYQALSCGPKSMYLRRFLSLLVLNTTERSRDGIKRKLYRPYDFSPHVCRLTEAERVFLTVSQALSCGPKSMYLRRFSSLLVLNTTERSRDGIKRKLYRPYDFSPHVCRLTEAERVLLTAYQALSCGPKSMHHRRFSSLLVLNTTKRSRDGIKRKLYRPYDFSPHVRRLTEAERVLLTAYQALSCGPKSMHHRRFSSLLVLNTTKRSRDGIKRKLYRQYDFSPHVCRLTEAEKVFLTVSQALSCGPKSMYLRRFSSLLVLNTTKRSRDGIKRKLYRPYDFSPHVCRLTEAERVFLTVYQALSCGPKSMYLRRFSSLLVLNTTERSRDGIKRKLYRPYDFSPHVCRLTEAERVFLTVYQALSCGPKSMYLRRFSSLLVLNTTERSRDGIKRKLYRPYDFSPHVCRLTEAERVLLTAYQALSCGPKSMHHRRFSSLLVLNTTKRSRDGIKRKLYRPYDFSPHVRRLTEAERVLLTAYQALSCGPKSMHHRRFSSLLVLNTTKRSRDGIKRKLYRPYDFSPHVCRLTEAERVFLTVYQALSCGPKSMYLRRFSSLLVLNTTERSRDGIKRKLYRPYDFSPHVCRLTEAERVFLTVYQALSCGPKSMYLRRFSSLLVLNTTERSRDGIKRKLYRPYDFSPHVCRLTEAERVFLTVYQALSCGPKSMYLRRFSSLLVLNTTERSRDGTKRKLYRQYDFSPHVCRLTEAEKVFLTVSQALSCGPKSMYLRRFSSLLVLNTTKRSRDGIKRKLYRPYDFSPHVCRLTEAERVFLTVYQALSCGPKSMYLRRFSSLLVLNTTKRSRDGIKRKLYRPYDFSPHVCRLTEAERVFLTVYQALSCGPKSMYLRRFSSLLVLNTTERSRDGIKRKLYRPYDFSPHVCRLTEAERVFLTVYQALSCGPKSMYLRRFSSLLVLNTTKRSRDGIKRKLYRPYDFSPHVCRLTEAERVLLTAYQALSCGPKSMHHRRFSSLLVLNTTKRSRDGIKRKLYRPYDFSPHVCRLTEAERVFLTVYQALSCGPKSMYLRRFSSLLVLNTTERSRDGIKRKLYRPYDFSPHVCRLTEAERVFLTVYQALSCGPKSMYLRRFSSLLVLNTTKRSRDGIKRKLYRPYDFSPHVCRLTEAERVFLTVYQALSCGPKSMYLRRFSSLLVLNTTERSRDGTKRKLYRQYDFSPHVCRLTEAEKVFLTVSQALSCGPKSMYLRRFSSLLVLNTTKRSRDGIKRKLYRPYDFSPHVCRLTEAERVFLTVYQALSCGPKSMYLRRFLSLLVLNTTERSRDGIKRKLYRPYDFSPHVCRLTEAERVFLTVYQALSCGPKSMYLRRFSSLLVLNTTERSRDGIKRKLYRPYDFSPHVCRLTEAERVLLTAYQALSCGPKSMHHRRFSSLLVLNTTKRSRDGIKRKLYRPYDFSPHVRRLTEAERVLLTAYQALSCGPKSMHHRRFSSLLVLNTTKRSRDGIKRKLYRQYDFSPHVCRLTEAEKVFLTVSQALSCGPKSMYLRRFSSLLVLNTTKRSRDGIKRKLYRPYDFSPHVCRLTEAERVFLTVYQALSCGPKSMYLRRFSSLLVLNTTERSRDGIKRKLYRPYDFSPHVCRLTEAERVFLTVYQALSCGPKSMYLRRFSSLLVLNTTERSRDGIKRKLYRPYDFSPHVCRLTEAERVLLTAYQALSCGPKSMHHRRFSSLLVLNTTKRSRDGIKRKLYRPYDFSPHVRRLTEAERVLLTAYQALSCGPKSMHHRRFSSLLVLNTTKRSRDGIKRKLYRPYDFSPHVCRLTEAERVFLTVYQALSCGPKSMYLRRFSSLLVLNTTERSRDGIKRKLYRPYDFSPHVCRLTEAERVFLTVYQALSCGPKSMYLRRFSSLLVLNTTERSRDGIKRKLYRPYDFSPHVCRLTEAERVFLTVYQALSCGPKSMYLRRFSSLLVLNTTERSRDGTKRKLYRQYDFSPHVCRLTEAEKVFLTVSQALSCGPKSMYLRRFSSLLVLNTTKRSRDGIKRTFHRPIHVIS
ncbi:chitin synthase [Nitzschia inconspicua]|uniref:Chitin synthase n=1 Tax=Nitzschia inconspicua TaxID=303405 RepID=A0A9K3LBC4_9STRA|nr:chitin synthase [Nitzschia inconspicua]